MNKVSRSLTGILMIAFSSAAFAEGWSGQGELGFSKSSGNSDSSQLSAKLGVKKKYTLWSVDVGLEANRSTEDGETTGERYVGEGQFDRSFSDKSYGLVGLRYEKDKYSGYEYNTSAKVGLGYRLIKTLTMGLKIEAGVGLRQTKLEDANEEKNGAVGTLKDSFTWDITKTTSIAQELSIEHGANNTQTQLDLGLQVRMTETLALKLSYTVNHNSDVPEGNKNRDTYSSVNLVYDF